MTSAPPRASFLASYLAPLSPYLGDSHVVEVAINPDGTPKVVGYEDVCMAITIPKGAEPKTGWPVIIYGHGTGGSLRSGPAQVGLAAATLSPMAHSVSIR